MTQQVSSDLFKIRQRYDLDLKIRFSKKAITTWYEYWNGNVYVSFSGGKDSTVLLHLVRSMYPEVKGVFLDTGLEYPEIRQFVKETENILWIKPKMNFVDVLSKYGYPIISKDVASIVDEIRNTKSLTLKDKRLWGDKTGHGKLGKKWWFLLEAPFKISAKCCYALKKGPVQIYERSSLQKPILGILAEESKMRIQTYLKYGCNAFDQTRPRSNPLSFWKDQDIWNYLKRYSVPYSKIYDLGYVRTGCAFCMFGVHLEEFPNRFQKMKVTHPKYWNYCINDLQLSKPLEYLKIPYK